MISNDAGDVLARATRALRDDQPLPPTDPTWLRVVRDVRRARRRRRWMSVAALQLLVLLAATGVWAAVTGRLPVTVKAAPAPMFVPAAEPPPPRHRARAIRVIPVTVAEPAQSPADTPAEPPVDPPATIRETPPHPKSAVEAPPARTLEYTPTPVRTVDALYLEAHRLHFERRDFAAALAAWDWYLAGNAGAFMTEAHYNRAIALAHLGRHADAIRALRPFADGEQGGYRQKEARALIERFGRPISR